MQVITHNGGWFGVTARIPGPMLGSQGTYNSKYQVWFNAMVPGGFYSWD
jgi:hypothetical protein